jgi:3',5'-cyclic-AMP phosphodiesterase
MPLIIDRRSFLKTALALPALTTGSALLTADPAVTHMALLADTHIAADPDDTFRGFKPHQNLKTAVTQVTASKFDLALVNGDLARLKGLPEDYAAFDTLIDPIVSNVPTVVTMGNHDDRKNARSALIKRAGDIQAVEQKFVTTLDAGALNFVMLDSLLATNVTPGQLGHMQRDWLAQYLDSQKKPTIVYVHHPPDPESDTALVDADRFLSIVSPRKSVKAVIFGHTHVYKLERQNGLHLINIPAVGYNFEDGNPVGWVEATLSQEGASLTLHALAGDTTNNGKIDKLTWR